MLRSNLKVTMDYYTDGDVIFILYSRNSIFRLEKVKGITRKGGPIKLKSAPAGFVEGRPVYEVITVNGVTDIIEHRVKGPIFHVTDDPAIWEELRVKQK